MQNTDIFKDRIDAGIQLAKRLRHFKKEDVVVLAIPRGGLPLGVIVAKELNAPLDVVLSKKIGHPYNREYAIGAVNLENRILTNAIGVTKSYIEEETTAIRKKLKERHQQYHKNRPEYSLSGKTAIIIDDGMATGNTILATVPLLLQQKAKQIIVAVPVASLSAIRTLEKVPEVKKIVCIKTPRDFKSVGQFYTNFPQVTDQEAIQYLEEMNKKE
ncbi:phosphoribosyltransferase family protein [Maribacter sp.]|uniref:phosphoribosyltransferase n=1 Tax=Maribacter sp. TaxID=1897614 RepID=UPI0025C3C5B3|nr:phosphoribosyltransferase family protein [Maribacter sp.]